MMYLNQSNEEIKEKTMNGFKNKIDMIIKSHTSRRYTSDQIIEAMNKENNWIKLSNYLIRSMNDAKGNVNNKDDYYTLVPAIIEPDINDELLSDMWTVYTELSLTHDKNDFIGFISNLNSDWKWIAEKVAVNGY